jgi:uncharacterized membrane protein
VWNIHGRHLSFWGGDIGFERGMLIFSFSIEITFLIYFVLQLILLVIRLTPLLWSILEKETG